MTPESIPTSEDLHTEFKAAKRALPKNLFDSICAFLNTDGGTVYLGIDDQGGIEGVDPDAAAELKKEIASLSNNVQKLDPPYLLFPKTIEVEGKTIIRLDVPLSSQLHQHKGAIYLRSEDGDYRVSGQHQLAGLLNRKLSIFTEQTPMPQFKVEDLRPELFEKARGLMRIRNQNHPWLGLNDVALLQRSGLLIQDGNHETPQLTLAAILLFGSDEVIHQAVPGYKFDCLLRRKNTERYDDRLTLRTNLLDAYEQMMGFVEKHLNDPFYLEGGISISLRERIFREAISNIIAHREYRDASPARLVIYKDRVLLDNPSTQYFHRPITPENLKSHPKNPTLCQFLIQLGLFDELGSGVLNINKYLPHYANGALPRFVDAPEGFELTLPLGTGDRGQGSGDRAQSGAQTGQVPPQVAPQVEQTEAEAQWGAQSKAQWGAQSNAVLHILFDAPLSAHDISEKLKMRGKSGALKRTLKELLEKQQIEYTIPDKPNSRLQKYRLTPKGKALLPPAP